jgi:hypothetical protein
LKLSEICRGREGIEKRGRSSHYWNTFGRFMWGDNAIADCGMQTQKTISIQRQKVYLQSPGAKMCH